MGKLAIELFTELMSVCIPFAVAWGLCGIIVRTFLKAGFGGRFEI